MQDVGNPASKTAIKDDLVVAIALCTMVKFGALAHLSDTPVIGMDAGGRVLAWKHFGATRDKPRGSIRPLVCWWPMAGCPDQAAGPHAAQIPAQGHSDRRKETRVRLF